MLDRAYGAEDNFKERKSYLLPDEKPRKPYSWPLTNACPHCGSIGWFDKNELAGVGHCFACGTWVYREEPIPWQRESNARLVHRPPKRREITATCQKCGKEFPTNNHNGMVKWCPECRDDIRREKENARLKAKREAKKKANNSRIVFVQGGER